MDCTFSDPVDYQGNTPATDISSFAFKTSHCNISQFATPAAQTQVASVSAISFSPSLNHSIGLTVFVFAFLLLAIVFFLAFDFGRWFYRR
jgi:hypothetical protein